MDLVNLCFNPETTRDLRLILVARALCASQPRLLLIVIQGAQYIEDRLYDVVVSISVFEDGTVYLRSTY